MITVRTDLWKQQKNGIVHVRRVVGYVKHYAPVHKPRLNT